MNNKELLVTRPPRKLNFWLPATECLQRFSPDRPVIALLGSSRFNLVATRFTRVEGEDFWGKTWPGSEAQSDSDDALPFLSGYMGALSYDDFSGVAAHPLTSQVYRIGQGILFDHVKQECWQIGDDDDPYDLEPSQALLLDDSPWVLAASATSEQYLRDAAAVIEEIRSGRYYQLNLLRYFSANLAENPVHRRAQILGRLAGWGGPMACLFATAEIDIVSFSPERFLSVVPTAAGLRATANPIKGTRSRAADRKEDRQAATALLRSEKDLAELHMIVDLMRNDLSAVSVAGSVRVETSAQLKSFPSVHHLEAVVTSLIRQDLPLRVIMQALCPAGSITGAPKREVMLAIAEREGRSRGFFMGNAFYLDDRGFFDASVLIRTLQKTSSGWCYAAGSGLTVRSDPQEEAQEILTKCQVVTQRARAVELL